ncbi:VacJ family lipoprotein [Rhodoferax ferrireducens]|uniref:MlaA family lipoprotein n=1 Tax=Rhodoferax ferrireducens TaxID=192843 RepID=UPI00298DCFAC|nr:VacJ family lipoprotein [Rhodoferax ferrireducens]WPC65784.1 VacJ family lipoprotein [Rhodoferax ferrireducens]
MRQRVLDLQRHTPWAGLVLLLMALTGCASGPDANPHDPLEPFNRGVYQFNDAVDVAVIKPVATTYQDVLPAPVRRGVRNFFANLQDAWSGVNNALQFKGEPAANSFMRFGVNTFLGLGGILDVASEMRIERHTKDFGHTLGYWGVAPGPYLVLPLLGPSTLRDTAALPVDAQGDLVSGIEHIPTRNSVILLRLVDTRASLLGASSMLEAVALDKYTFTRDAYLQRRRSSIYDGNPPDDGEVEKSPVKQDLSKARERTRAWVQTLKESGPSGDEKAKP